MSSYGKIIGVEEIKGAAQIPYLKRDIGNYQKMIEINKSQIEKLNNPEYLRFMPQEERDEAIAKSKKSIENDEWLISIMNRQLTDLLREFPDENV